MSSSEPGRREPVRRELPAPVGRWTCRGPYPASQPAQDESWTLSDRRLRSACERTATECSAAVRAVEGLIYRRNQTTSSPPHWRRPACLEDFFLRRFGF